MRHLEDLSEVEQRLFYTRVLCTNFNFLYQHLNTLAILKKLEERGLIEHHRIKTISELSGVCAQNILAVLYMQQVTAPPNCMEKLCEILNQDHIARKLFCGKTLPYLYFYALFKHGNYTAVSRGNHSKGVIPVQYTKGVIVYIILSMLSKHCGAVVVIE